MSGLIRKSLDQIRRDGYANVKAVAEQKANAEKQKQKAMAPNNDYMDFRNMIQSQATKDTANHFSLQTAEKEIDDYFEGIRMRGYRSNVEELIRDIAGQKPSAYSLRRMASFLDDFYRTTKELSR